MKHTGLDVRKQSVVATSIDDTGKVLKQFRFPTAPKALTAFATSLGKDDAVCLESTTNAVPIYSLLEGRAGRVVDECTSASRWSTRSGGGRQ